MHRRDAENAEARGAMRVFSRLCHKDNAAEPLRSLRPRRLAAGMAARRGVWALARFLHRKRLPGRKEKNASVACQGGLVVPNLRIAKPLRRFDKAFFSFSPVLEIHGAQKRAKAHSPGPLRDHAPVSFVLLAFPACARARTIASKAAIPAPPTPWRRARTISGAPRTPCFEAGGRPRNSAGGLLTLTDRGSTI